MRYLPTCSITKRIFATFSVKITFDSPFFGAWLKIAFAAQCSMFRIWIHARYKVNDSRKSIKVHNSLNINNRTIRNQTLIELQLKNRWATKSTECAQWIKKTVPLNVWFKKKPKPSHCMHLATVVYSGGNFNIDFGGVPENQLSKISPPIVSVHNHFPR